MIYLTFGDQPSGVYQSQVVDVAKYMGELSGSSVRLVSFVSIRGFSETRKKIQALYPDAIVKRSWPKLTNWRKNYRALKKVCRRTGEKKIVCRGVFATLLAIRLRDEGIISTVVLDGRGAYAAEWNEYDVVPDEALKREISGFEKKVVLEADLRIAVSQKLVEYWRSEYGYEKEDHVIIPCTIREGFAKEQQELSVISKTREKYGYKASDILLVYAGSVAGWQSLDALDRLLLGLVKGNSSIKVIFLAKMELESLRLHKEFPENVDCRWLPHKEVADFLGMCDYGILIRELSVTNKVAAPTKFAEYLSCGIKVLISEGIGDYTEMVRKDDLGYIMNLDSDRSIPLSGISEADRKRCSEYGVTRFSKEYYETAYRTLIEL